MTDTELRRLAESNVGIADVPLAPDVIIALLNRCERAESTLKTYENRSDRTRTILWTDDASGVALQSTFSNMNAAETEAYTLHSGAATALRDFFRGVRIDALRARCERAEKERDALRAHAAKGGE